MKQFLAVLFLTLAWPLAAWAATATQYTDNRVQTSAVFASGGTTTSELDLGGTMIVGIQMPSSFTGTTIKFQAATASGGTFQTVADGAGSDVSKTVTTSKYIAIDPDSLRGIRWLKLVSGSTEPADRTVTIFSIPAH